MIEASDNVKQGIVARYNREKGFGFLELPYDEPEIEPFFHINDISTPIERRIGQLCLEKYDPYIFLRLKRPERIPQIGDRVACIPERTERGLRAGYWTYWEIWHYARYLIDQRPDPEENLFVVRRYNGLETAKIIWQGSRKGFNDLAYAERRKEWLSEDIVISECRIHGWHSVII
jgi:hypothetical protein